jgi:Fic family protein
MAKAMDSVLLRPGPRAPEPMAGEPHFFIPPPLPRRFALGREARAVVDSAEWALARLSGLCEMIPDLADLMRPATVREAIASSRIEGLEVTLGEVLLTDDSALDPARKAIRDVRTLADIMSLGSEMVESEPLNRHLVSDLHRTLLFASLGHSSTPGALRDKPLHIKVPRDDQHTVRVIPAPTESPSLLIDWEDYISDPPTLPLVVRLALTHHRFEAIRPFEHANGTLARVLIGLQLVNEGVLPAPLLTLSSAIHDDLTLYQQTFSAGLDSGEMEPWVVHFASMVEAESTRAHRTVIALHHLRQSMRLEATGESLLLLELAHTLFRHPIVSLPLVQRTLQVTERIAVKLIERAEQLGWVRHLWQPQSSFPAQWWAPYIWAEHTADPP